MMRPALLRKLLLCSMVSFPVLPLAAQTSSAPAAQTAPRILGTVTAVSDTTVTVKPEASGDAVQVAVSPQTRLLRLAPGEKNLKNATPLAMADLAVGDRVLIRPTADSASDHPVAGVLIAMKQDDITQAHAQEASDWQTRGVAGIAQAVDPAANTITLKPQAGAPPIVIQTTAITILRHYAPDSTAFADAKKIPFTDIHAGDQIRARGAKDDAGTHVAAEELVAGSFRNIAGTVLSVDSTANTIAFTDLATKKPVTLHLEPTAQLRKLPPEMAARMARRTGASGPMGPGAAGGTASGGRPAPASSATGSTPATTGTPAATGSGAPESGPGGRARGGDMAGMLQRAPAITLADLKKGDAVMIVASGPGAATPTAITLIAGVEPLLQASPEASAGLFSASWNLNGGGGEAGGGEGGGPR